MVALECRPKEITNNKWISYRMYSSDFDMLWEESRVQFSDSLYEDGYKITDTKGCYMDEKN